jgi:phosphatidylserine decarboxylase
MGQIPAGLFSPIPPGVWLVLTAWQTPESKAVLGNHALGWFGKTGLKDLVEVANRPRGTSMTFDEMYVCDSSKENYGFTSWDGTSPRTRTRLTESALTSLHDQTSSLAKSATRLAP